MRSDYLDNGLYSSIEDNGCFVIFDDELDYGYVSLETIAKVVGSSNKVVRSIMQRAVREFPDVKATVFTESGLRTVTVYEARAMYLVARILERNDLADEILIFGANNIAYALVGMQVFMTHSSGATIRVTPTEKDLPGILKDVPETPSETKLTYVP